MAKLDSAKTDVKLAKVGEWYGVVVFVYNLHIDY